MSGLPKPLTPSSKRREPEKANELNKRNENPKASTMKRNDHNENFSKHHSHLPLCQEETGEHAESTSVKQTNTEEKTPKKEDNDPLRSSPKESANPGTLHSREETEKTPRRRGRRRRSRGRLLRNQCVE